MCIYIYIINIDSALHTHILCKQKLLFWMRLITINHLTALILKYIQIEKKVILNCNNISQYNSCLCIFDQINACFGETSFKNIQITPNFWTVVHILLCFPSYGCNNIEILVETARNFMLQQKHFYSKKKITTYIQYTAFHSNIRFNGTCSSTIN